MADRMDVDALLISALYGELTPADEARLTAHLESHPADRTALADLTQTRTQVRESRILAVQLEPPQSVSALLLQEAARRAPRPARPRHPPEAEGWLQRFLRSFAAHPAMAAAMTLVLVVGVASMLYVRHVDQFGETPAPAVARAPAASETASIATPAPSPPTGASASQDPAASTPPAAVAPGRFGDGNAATAEGRGSAMGSGSYQVGLDEAAPQADALDRQRLAKADTQDDRPKGGSEPRKIAASDGADRAAFAPAPAHAAPETPSDKRPSPKKSAGIELQRREMQPKELDDDRKLVKSASPDRQADPQAGNEVAANDRLRAAGGGGATASAGMIAPRPQAPAPAPAPAVMALPDLESTTVARTTPANGPRDAAKDSVKDKEAAKPASRGGLAQAQSPPPPSTIPAPVVAATAPRDSRRLDKFAAPPSPEPRADAKPEGKVEGKVEAKGEGKADAKAKKMEATADAKAEERPAEDKALLGWAQKQREQVIAYVRSNNCRAAANAANEIYNRAPEYYASNVEIDRTIKPCLPYLNSERERSERVKAAAKRANAADTPAQAAPPPARK